MGWLRRTYPLHFRDVPQLGRSGGDLCRLYTTVVACMSTKATNEGQCTSEARTMVWMREGERRAGIGAQTRHFCTVTLRERRCTSSTLLSSLNAPLSSRRRRRLPLRRRARLAHSYYLLFPIVSPQPSRCLEDTHVLTRRHRASNL